MGSSMSTTTSYQPRNPPGARGRTWRWRLAHSLCALALVAAVLVGGNEILKASRSPGDVIKSELVAAAAELESPVGPYPTEAANRAIRRHFRAHPAVLNTASWPMVSVTLQHLDRATCADARIVAHRVENLVVVELDGYRSAADCHDDNDMTWWILP